ncbi:MAG: patatin-like phospholipase family protein [Paludibacteraceae bacterium]|nr:patatin-like phospholipase family protein [Paludibacteraceae bacterium]MBR1480502.1 patatin-like phospholipase family protein [Paludibacteraceae bacterium]
MSEHSHSRNVALTLGSGGARGLAHIGAIEEIERRGYRITSLSGCSMGSLIGGIYAAGKLHEARAWFSSLTRQQVLSLTDFSIGLSHVVKGDRVMQAIQEWVPDCAIETLPIPLTLVATDIIHSREVLFRSGSLFEAIRASISIPLCFEPVQWQDTLLVDGGLCNPLPLNRVARREGDLLVGVNISGRSVMQKVSQETWTLPDSPAVLDKLGSIGDKMEHAWQWVANSLDSSRQNDGPATPTAFELLNRTIDLQIQANCRLMTELMKPDIVVEMAQDEYTTFDFDRATEIIDKGRTLMAYALDKYEEREA